MKTKLTCLIAICMSVFCAVFFAVEHSYTYTYQGIGFGTCTSKDQIKFTKSFEYSRLWHWAVPTKSSEILRVVSNTD